MSIYDDLPRELADLIAPWMGEESPLLADIAKMITGKIEEAKKARTRSGIETTWANAEDAYAAIDDANRGEARGMTWHKPYSMEGVLTRDVGPSDPNRSSAFIRVTGRYVDAALAKIQETILPPAEKSFSLRPTTPVPDLSHAKERNIPARWADGSPMMRDLTPEEIAAQGQQAPPPIAAPAPAAGASLPGGNAPGPMAGGVAGAAPAGMGVPAGAVPPQPGQPQEVPQKPITEAEFAEENMKLAMASAKLAEEIIFDWMKELHYTREMRKVIFDCARLGVGIFKGPFPSNKQATVVSKTKDGVEIEFEDKIIPGGKWVSPWNIFPEDGCGENIGDGQEVSERDWLSEAQLQKLSDLPGYLPGQIKEVIKEGPGKRNYREDGPQPKGSIKDRYEIWHYHGTLTRKDMECLCVASGTTLRAYGIDRRKKLISVVISLVNERVVCAVPSMFVSGRLPYHNIPWQRRPGFWAGVGVAEQLEVPQRMINGATRAMLDNAALAAGPQIVINRRAIRAADEQPNLYPQKLWYLEPDYDGVDVRTCFMVAEIPNTTQAIMQINEWALRVGEESTSIPLVTQGQSGATSPETFGATQLQNNNAMQLLRSIGYAFDDAIEPFIQLMYEWLLQDPGVPAAAKGDFHVVVNGSAALVERAIQDQTIAQLLPFSKDPAYGLSPDRTTALYLRSKKIDREDVVLSDEEKKAIAAQPPPEDPRIAAAKIRAGVDAEAMKIEGKNRDKELDIKAKDVESDVSVRLHEIEARTQLALAEYANRNQMTISQAKADLAKELMKLRTQVQLATMPDNGGGQNGGRKPPRRQPRRTQPATPPTEPPGRAQPGRSFQA